MNSAFRKYRTDWKQTWRGKDGGKNPEGASWTWSHYIITWFKAYPLPENGDTVELSRMAVKKYPRIPRLTQRTFHRWALPRIIIPLLMHYAYSVYFHEGTVSGLHPVWAFLFYGAVFKYIGTAVMQLCQRLGAEYGYLDGDKPRDGVPDDSNQKIASSLIAVSEGRTFMTVMLAYRSLGAPPPVDSLDWWTHLPFKVALYPIFLDFWFYWYHRAMHESETLWKFHRVHHLTRHPNTLLTLFADFEQELFDVVGIPLMAYFSMNFILPESSGLRLDFYSWYVVSMYQMIIELFGHSGLRMYVTPTGGLGLLQRFGWGLIIEDHDLHHRQGWKSSGNYGKQTRIWDQLFGTVLPRQECVPENLDHNLHVQLPA